jgi:hypothetical protein
MNTFYGGGGVESRHALHGSSARGPSQGWCQSGFDSRLTDATTKSRSSALPASTYTHEEARYAEQYAKDACADAAPDLTGDRRAYQ